MPTLINPVLNMITPNIITLHKVSVKIQSPPIFQDRIVYIIITNMPKPDNKIPIS